MNDESRPFGILTMSERTKTPDRKQYGATGTVNYQGFISGHEYSNDLKGTKLLDVVDKMMSDGTVWGSYMLVTLPLRAATWSIEPGDNKDAAEWVEKTLFDLGEDEWDEFLVNALDYLPYGRMLFEMVWAFDEDEKKWFWQRLAPRLPKTILRWNRKGGKLDSVTQLAQEDDGVHCEMTIPAEKLVLFVNMKKGDNYEGRSIFRAAYKHWFYKEQFYLISALAGERQGLGVPWMKHPPNLDDEDKAKVMKVLENLRSHQSLGVRLEAGYEFGIEGVTGETMDMMPWVKHHDERIAAQVLAQFSMLGTTDTGSRSVGEVQQDPYYMALQAVAKQVEAQVNKAIRILVDVNFAGVKEYPKLSCSKMMAKNMKVMSEALKNLCTAGFDFSDPETQEYVRELFDLPTDIAKKILPPVAPGDPADEIPPVDGNLPVETKPSKGQPAPAGTAKEQDAAIEEAAEGCECGVEHLAAPTLSADGELTTWRAPQGAEMFMALADMVSEQDHAKERLVQVMEAGGKEMVEPLVKRTLQAVQMKNIGSIQDEAPQGQDNLASRIGRVFADEFRRGRQEVRDELDRQREGKSINPLIRQRQEGKRVFSLAAGDASIPAEIWQYLENEASLLAAARAAKLKTAALVWANKAIRDGSLDVGTLQAVLESAVTEGLLLSASMKANIGFGQGRQHEASLREDDIEAAIYTAILDASLCYRCKPFDDMKFGSVSEANAKAPAPNPNCEGGDACRCMYVYVLKSETKPSVSDYNKYH